MPPDPIYKRGDFVRVDFNAQVVKAMVTMASANGRSLLLMFDGALMTAEGGMLVGNIGLLYENDAYHSIVGNGIATLTRV
jgi:hypothetical protein